MSDVNYAAWAKKMGYKPKKGHEYEFEKYAEELHKASFDLKFIIYTGTDEDVQRARMLKADATNALKAVSR